MTPATVVRIARPTGDLRTVVRMYVEGLGFEIVDEFRNHGGFDGVIVALPDAPYHLEFTSHHGRDAAEPDCDQLLVLYLPDAADWSTTCARMEAAGFEPVVACNPFWERDGRTFRDSDGYRVVLQRAAWPVSFDRRG